MDFIGEVITILTVNKVKKDIISRIIIEINEFLTNFRRKRVIVRNRMVIDKINIENASKLRKKTAFYFFWYIYYLLLPL